MTSHGSADRYTMGADSMSIVISRIQDAIKALEHSMQSLQELYRLPSDAAHLAQLRWSILSDAMKDREARQKEFESLLRTTRLITMGCIDIPGFEGDIANDTECGVKESFDTAAKLIVYYSNALLHLKNVKAQIDEKILPKSSAISTPQSNPNLVPVAAKKKRRLNSLKLVTWFFKIMSYARHPWRMYKSCRGRRASIGRPERELSTENSSNDHRTDFLVAALAFKDLDNASQSLYNMLVSVEEYNHFVYENTKEMVAWIKGAEENVKELTKLSLSFETTLNDFNGTLDVFEAMKPKIQEDVISVSEGIKEDTAGITEIE